MTDYLIALAIAVPIAVVLTCVGAAALFATQRRLVDVRSDGDAARKPAPKPRQPRFG